MLRQAVSLFQMKIFLICSENRHLAEWRFSRFFTMIVTVKAPIYSVKCRFHPKHRRTAQAAAAKAARSAVRAAGMVYRVRRIPAAPKYTATV